MGKSVIFVNLFFFPAGSNWRISRLGPITE